MHPCHLKVNEGACCRKSSLLGIVCRVSIKEKVRRSPKDFVRNGNEREREGGGGAEVGSRETSSKTNWLEGPH